MIKHWLGLLLVLAFLWFPGAVWADELPPGDDVIINETTIIDAEPMPEDDNLMESPPYLNEPGIPIPVPVMGNQSEPAAAPVNEPAKTEPVPAVTAKVIAEFATPLINSPANRNHNINQALMALNGQIIKAGSTWSFNQTVGPRTVQRGYKKAMIIVNKKFVPGIGGGVCQVASTMYNVILAAKLQVMERHPHSLPVKYVPAGRDAAISYGIQDLKFTNNLAQDLIIKTKMEKQKVVIGFYVDQPELAAFNGSIANNNN